jgi:hypothetical protein
MEASSAGVCLEKYVIANAALIRMNYYIEGV